MPDITIVTKRDNWGEAVASLEPVPRGININCRESGINDLFDGSDLALFYSSDLNQETLQLFVSQLNKKWSGVTCTTSKRDGIIHRAAHPTINQEELP